MIKGQIGAGFKGYGPNCNVINFIYSLAEFSCEGLHVWIDNNDWLRTTTKRSPDPNVIFPDDGREASVIGLRTNSELFNFSLFVKAYCKVKWNKSLIDAYVLRTFPVITDGELNMKRLYMSVNDYLFGQFSDAGILNADKQLDILPPIESGPLYSVDLEGMDLVSSQWANPRVLGLVGLLRLEQDLIRKRETFESNFPKDYLNKPTGKDVSSRPNIPFYREQVPKSDSGQKTKVFRTARTVIYSIGNYRSNVDVLLPHTESPMLSQIYQDIKEELERVRSRIRCIVFACELNESNIMGWDKKLEFQTIEFEDARISRAARSKNMRK